MDRKDNQSCELKLGATIKLTNQNMRCEFTDDHKKCEMV